jgi:hypothetical protein
MDFLPQYDSVYLSEENKLKALSEFSELFQDDIPVVLERMRKRFSAKANEKKNTVFDPAIRYELLLRGLYSIFENNEIIPTFDNSDLAYFFIYYFIRVYNAVDDKSKANLRKEFRDKAGHTKDPNQITALFLELSVAQTFQYQQCQVEFLEAGVKDGVDSPDLLVTKGDEKLFVECKCIGGLVAPPIEDSARDAAMGLLIKFLASISSGGFDFTVFAFFKGTNESDKKTVIEDLQKLLETVEVPDHQYDLGLWGVFFLPTPRTVIQNHLNGKFDGYMHGILQNSYSAAVIPNDGFIVLGTENSTNIDVTIANRFDKALGQLPKNSKRVVWVQVIGVRRDHRGIFFPSSLKMLWENKRFSDRMRQQNEKSDGFMGLILSTDYEIENRGQLKFLNYSVLRIQSKDDYRSDLAPFLSWEVRLDFGPRHNRWMHPVRFRSYTLGKVQKTAAAVVSS